MDISLFPNNDPIAINKLIRDGKLVPSLKNQVQPQNQLTSLPGFQNEQKNRSPISNRTLGIGISLLSFSAIILGIINTIVHSLDITTYKSIYGSTSNTVAITLGTVNLPALNANSLINIFVWMWITSPIWGCILAFVVGVILISKKNTTNPEVVIKDTIQSTDSSNGSSYPSLPSNIANKTNDATNKTDYYRILANIATFTIMPISLIMTILLVALSKYGLSLSQSIYFILSFISMIVIAILFALLIYTWLKAKTGSDIVYRYIGTTYTLFEEPESRMSLLNETDNCNECSQPNNDPIFIVNQQQTPREPINLFLPSQPQQNYLPVPVPIPVPMVPSPRRRLIPQQQRYYPSQMYNNSPGYANNQGFSNIGFRTSPFRGNNPGGYGRNFINNQRMSGGISGYNGMYLPNANNVTPYNFY